MKPSSLIPLLLIACSGAIPGGQPSDTSDADADGFRIEDGDCDDTDPDVSPLGVEVPLDGIDQDCDGADADALPLAALEVGDLRVTEVQRDALGVGSAGEWIELYNARDLPVELEGLLVRDDTTDDSLVVASLVIEAGGRLILAARLDPELNGGVDADAEWAADFGLSKGEDQVVLEGPQGELDRVVWGVDFPGIDGATASRDPEDPTRWCAGVTAYGIGGYGSPGESNPRCPPLFDGLSAADLADGDLVITEILQAPEAVDGDFGEWIEVHNRSGDDVDLQGITLSDESGDGVTIAVSVIVAAGDHAVLASSLDPSLNGGLDADWAWGWDYGLRNSGQTVTLSFGTRTLDTISYDNGLTFPDPEGASMSLDPDAEDNSLGAAWCIGATPYGEGDLGTPGEANPPCP